MDDISMDRLLSGDPTQVPNLPKRVVRLFISSTFTDMTLERNTLMERVYPRLKKYCRERYGLDFQVVDMRWGVRDEATDDHQTVNLCSREIDNCQRVSLGPNFIALIGDKYGFRPLLNCIKSSDYRLLRRCLIESDINTDFLDTWYKEDLNAVPPEYLLQPISSILKNFTNRNEPELQMVDQRIWQAIQERLHELLLIGSSRLVKQGRLSEREQLLKYSISVTEREVLEGCLDINEPKSHCLVYVRSIQDLRDNLSKCMDASRALSRGSTSLDAASGMGSESADLRRDSATRKASLKIGEDTISLTASGAMTAAERKIERTRRLIGRYIDLTSKDGETQIDEVAQEALKELKEIKLSSRLASSRNLTYYKVHWNEQDGISLKSEEHKNYLNSLTDHFYGNLTRMIRSAVKSERGKSNTSGLLGEVLQHSHYALRAGNSVYARDDEFDQIRCYIITGQYKQQQSSAGGVNLVLPMFVFGVSGSGKTSILARAASMAFSWIERSRKRRRSSASLQLNDLLQSSTKSHSKRWDRKPCIIMRFCCTTPASSSMVGLLTSVCRQLQYNFYQFGPLNGLIDQRDQLFASSSGRYNQLAYQKIPQDFVRLVYTFRQLIENCAHQLHRQRVFVIILDSVERLSSPAESSVEAKYSWLTSITQLPANVRLIISCSSTGDGTAQIDYAHLKRHFLQVHLAALTKINPSFSHVLDSEQLETGSTSGDESGSESLDLSASSSSKSQSGLDLMRQDSPIDGSRQTKYGQLLRRLILPAVRLRRASRIDIGQASTSRPRPGIKFAAEMPVARVPTNVSPSREIESQFRSGASSGSGRDDQDDFWTSARRSNYLGLLHVRPLGKDAALQVLKRWLADSGRNLSQQQWTIVARSFAHCSRPIFVKLALGEVMHWKSYSTQGDTRGLTFGSAWLAEMQLDENGIDAGRESTTRGELLKLVQKSEASRTVEEEATKFKWQMLAMEQQWLNFLDYKSRQAQQTATAESEAQGQDESQNLVIRITGSATMIGGEREKSIGSAANSTTINGSPSMSICHLSNSIEDAISQLFARIELQHGYLLTKHSLSYITAARNGICENELEDILSLDDVVLDDVFQYHLPPVRRIPPLLWTRIRNDLPDYLSERDADGIVITWHHSEFKAVTERRYLDEAKQLVYIHSLLADYFLGKWADKAKPFRCTKQQIQMAAEQLESAVQQSTRESASGQSGTNLVGSMRGSGRLGSSSARAGTSFSVRNRLRSSDQHDQRLQWMQAKADRRVPHQPLYYELDNSGEAPNGMARSANTSMDEKPHANKAGATASNDHAMDMSASNNHSAKRYNLRKLTELPYHLLRAGRFNELAVCVFFNYKWLLASVQALGLQSLFADFDEALECLRSKLLEHTDREPGELSGRQMPAELQINDCVPSDEFDADVIGDMIKQIELLGSTLRLSSSIIQGDPQMLAPQLVGRLIAVVNGMKQALIGDTMISDDARGRRPAASTKSSRLTLLGHLLDQCDKDGSTDCALLPTDHCLQSPNGLQLSTLEGHPFGVTSMVLASDQRHLLAVSSRFIMWNISTGEIAREIDPKINGSLMKELVIGLNNQLAISYTSDNHILVLDILTQQLIKCEQMVDRDPIRGLKLVDHVGARRFCVWTQSSLFVFDLVDQNGPSNPNDPLVSSRDDSEATNVKLDYELDLDKCLPEMERLLLLAVEVSQIGYESELIYCTLNDQTDDSLHFLVYRSAISRGSKLLEPWHSSVRADSLVFSKSGTQLFYSTRSGDIFLRRRRQKSWSNPKLIEEGRKVGCMDAKVDLIKALDSTGSSRAPLVLEVEEPNGDRGSQDQLAHHMNDLNFERHLRFERHVDRISESDEISPSGVFSSIQRDRSKNQDRTRNTGVRFLKVYWPNRIDIIQLDDSSATHNHRKKVLVLPRDIRNVRTTRIESQLCSLMMQIPQEIHKHLLVVSSTLQILIFSVDSESLLRAMDAHAARITRLLPINQSSESGNKSRCTFGIASSSLDKAVKIWNLSNIDKESQSIDRMPGKHVDIMEICNQRPIVACLSRGRLSLWDWRTMRIVASYESSADFDGNKDAGVKLCPIVRCRFSSNGRYLALATTAEIIVLGLESSSVPASGRLARNLPDSTDWTNLKAVARSALPGAVLVLKLKFVAQDSRVLAMVRHMKDTNSNRTMTSASTSSSSASTSDDAFRMSHSVGVLCFALPDFRLQYQIECQIPERILRTERSHQISIRRRDGVKQVAGQDANRSKSIVLTCDLQLIVSLGTMPATDQVGKQTSPRRRSSAIERMPLTLMVHSARDGSFVKMIDLSQLQRTSEQFGVRGSKQFGNIESYKETKSVLLGQPALANHHQNRESSSARGDKQELVAIYGDQFNRIKSVKNRDRQSLIALLDDGKGSGYIIDVATGHFVGTTGEWNGSRLSEDGRYGLSRMSGSTAAGSLTSRAARKFPTSGDALEPNGRGLKLIEMRRCRTIKTILDADQMDKLSNSSELQSRGGQQDVLCGFNRPNDSYVYYCDSRLRRILLIRLRDSQIVANYKLSSRVTHIKSAADGLALVLVQEDGSLTSLAIVDPQASDTFTRLSQYPSRRGLQ